MTPRARGLGLAPSCSGSPSPWKREPGKNRLLCSREPGFPGAATQTAMAGEPGWLSTRGQPSRWWGWDSSQPLCLAEVQRQILCLQVKPPSDLSVSGSDLPRPHCLGSIWPPEGSTTMALTCGCPAHSLPGPHCPVRHLSVPSQLSSQAVCSSGLLCHCSLCSPSPRLAKGSLACTASSRKSSRVAMQWHPLLVGPGSPGGLERP